MNVTDNFLKHVRFVVDSEGKPTAALLDIKLWNYLIELLEDMEDIELAESALDSFEAADSDPERAGWFDFDKVSMELG
ncbi:MAG: hypothetical protein AAB427_02145 [Chloroflexota bacterium]